MNYFKGYQQSWDPETKSKRKIFLPHQDLRPMMKKVHFNNFWLFLIVFSHGNTYSIRIGWYKYTPEFGSDGREVEVMCNESLLKGLVRAIQKIIDSAVKIKGSWLQTKASFWQSRIKKTPLKFVHSNNTLSFVKKSIATGLGCC